MVIIVTISLLQRRKNLRRLRNIGVYTHAVSNRLDKETKNAT